MKNVLHKYIKYTLFIFFLALLITGCSTPVTVVAPPPIAAPQTKGRPIQIGSYITDITSENNQTQQSSNIPSQPNQSPNQSSNQSSGQNTPNNTEPGNTGQNNQSSSQNINQSGLSPSTPSQSGTLQPQTGTKNKINIALLAPLSGPAKIIGKAMQQGAQAALFTFKDSNINLMPFDTKGTPDGAEDAINKALDHHANVILGPLFASSTQAVQNIAASHNLSVITLSNSSNIQNNNTFVAGLTLDEQANNLVQYAAHNIKTIAIIAPDNPYGHVSATSLQNAAAEQGMSVVDTEFFDPTSHNFADMIKKMSNYDERKKALNLALAAAKRNNDTQKIQDLSARDTLGDLPYQGIVVVTTHKPTLQIIASQLAYYDTGEPYVQLLGLQTWSSFKALEKEPSLMGAYFVTQPIENTDKFNDTYQKIYGTRPTYHAALAYDLMGLLITISQHSSLDPQYMFVPSQLTSMPQGFEGVEGIFRFLPGGRVERRFAIARISKEGIHVIKKAETCFLCQ